MAEALTHDQRSPGGEGRLTVLWRALTERFRTSLFGVPSLWVAGSVLLWWLTRIVDALLDSSTFQMPFETTVDSARALLGAIASGTIAAASVVFSLTLVAIQLSSSTYSSRVLRTFLRDRFQQNMMGLVVATFFYCLLVLRDLRGPLEEGGTAKIPSVSVNIAILLALAAILALLASISHTARSVRVSSVSSAILSDSKRTIHEQFGIPGQPDSGDGSFRSAFDVQAPGVIPSPLRVAAAAGRAEEFSAEEIGALARESSDTDLEEPDLIVEGLAGGWIQQISIDALVNAVAAGSTVRLEVGVGTYVFEGSALCSVWNPPRAGRPEPPSAGGPEIVDQMRSAVRIGGERTLQQDVCFGITMLEDIALRALSPGINDPNTAVAIIPQLGELMLHVLANPHPPSRTVIRDVTVSRWAAPGYLDYLEVAFGQISRASGSYDDVRLTMERTLGSLGYELVRRGWSTPAAMSDLEEMLERVRESGENSGSR